MCIRDSTKTKKTKYRATVKNIKWFKKNFKLPCAAIGGIKVKNCRKIIMTDCDMLAVSSGVWNYKDGPVEAVNLFYKILNKEV